jgi:hypothetical protein
VIESNNEYGQSNIGAGTVYWQPSPITDGQLINALLVDLFVVQSPALSRRFASALRATRDRIDMPITAVGRRVQG